MSIQSKLGGTDIVCRVLQFSTLEDISRFRRVDQSADQLKIHIAKTPALLDFFLRVIQDSFPVIETYPDFCRTVRKIPFECCARLGRAIFFSPPRQRSFSCVISKLTDLCCKDSWERAIMNYPNPRLLHKPTALEQLQTLASSGASCEQIAEVFSSLDPVLQCDAAVLKKSMGLCPNFCDMLPKKLWQNPKFVLKVIELSLSDEEFQGRIRPNDTLPGKIPSKLLRDPEFASKVIELYRENSEFLQKFMIDPIPDILERLFENSKIALKALELGPSSIRHIPDSLLKNPEFAQEAIALYGHSESTSKLLELSNRVSEQNASCTSNHILGRLHASLKTTSETCGRYPGQYIPQSRLHWI